MPPQYTQMVGNLDAIMSDDVVPEATSSTDDAIDYSRRSSAVGTVSSVAGKVINGIPSGQSIASSVGSFAPTLATKTIENDGMSMDCDIPLGLEEEKDQDMSTVGSFAPTLATRRSTKSNMTSGTRRNEVVEVIDDGVSSVGSFAVSLRSAMTKQTTKSAATLRDRSIDLRASDQASIAMSSVGSAAPTLASKRSAKSLRNSLIGTTEDDGSEFDAVSSVGSKAPSLSTKKSTRTMRDNIIQTDLEDDAVSSVGSRAPTLATFTTKQSTRTLSNRFVETDMDADAVSSVGSAAPTLATKRSTRTSNTIQNKSFAMGSKMMEDVSTIGSRAPTLGASSVKTPKRKKQRSALKAPSRAIASGPRSTDDKKSLESKEDGKSMFSFDHYASDMALLGGVLGREDLKSGIEDKVGTFLRNGAFYGLVIYGLLLIVMFCVAPFSSYQYMNMQEQMANATLLGLFIAVNFNRLGPLLVNDRNWNFLTSGAMTAMITVQFIATVSVATMLFLPTPVLIDPIIGVRCHLVRWASWSALSFVMTFLTESIDLPLEDANTRHAWLTAIMMSLSTVCGGILPFCPNATIWMLVFMISCVLFSTIYVRLAWRGARLWMMSRSKMYTTSDKENFERAKYSFKLLAVCAGVWTVLVVSYSTCVVMFKFAEPGSFWKNDWLILAVENFCEGLSKIGYLSILMEVHELMFDDVSQTARRLGELRAYMSAVWDASSDVVIICSSHKHLVNAAVSPAFFQMENAFGRIAPKQKKRPSNGSISEPDDYKQTTLVMEVDPYEGSYRTYQMDLSKKMTRDEANTMMKASRRKARMVTPAFEKNLKVLSDLVCDACTLQVPAGENEYVVRKKFYCTDQDRKQHSLSCDAKVVKLKGKAFLILLRDVTPSKRCDETVKIQTREAEAVVQVEPVYVEPRETEIKTVEKSFDSQDLGLGFDMPLGLQPQIPLGLEPQNLDLSAPAHREIDSDDPNCAECIIS